MAVGVKGRPDSRVAQPVGNHLLDVCRQSGRWRHQRPRRHTRPRPTTAPGRSGPGSSPQAERPANGRRGCRGRTTGARRRKTKRPAVPAALAAAEADVCTAEAELRATRTALAEAPLWRRRGLAQRVDHAAQVVHAMRGRRHLAAWEADPFVTEIEALAADLQHADDGATRARRRDRLDRLTLASPTPRLERGVGIDPPGL